MAVEQSPKRMQEAWDREYTTVHAYTTSYRLDLDRGIEFLLAYHKEHDELVREPILDLGCGLGRNALPLARDGHTVIALDHSRAALDKLQESVNAEDLGTRLVGFQHDLGEPLPLPSASIGTAVDITAVDNLVDSDRRRRYGREVGRVLKPGGVFVVVTFAIDDGYYSRFLKTSEYADEGIVEDPNTGIQNQLFTHATLEAVFSPPLVRQVAEDLVFVDEAAEERWERRFLLQLYRQPRA